MELLHALGAIDDDAKLTSVVGVKLAELPLEPKLGKALLAGCDYGCANEMLTICSYFSIENTCFLPARGGTTSRNLLDEAKANFAAREGDGITSLNIQRGYAWNDRNRRGFCEENYLNFRTVQRVQSVRAQLKKLLTQRLDCMLIDNNRSNDDDKEKKLESILRAICAGFFSNAATLAPYGGGGSDDGAAKYLTIRNKRTVYVHQSSILYGVSSGLPQVVVYQTAEVNNENKEYIRNVSSVGDLRWFEDVAGHYYTF